MTQFDPDLDMLPPRLASPTGEPVTEYQRLIVNPLLAIVGLLGVWSVFHYSLQVRNLPLFLLSIALAVACAFLIQYHCLDCGRTDFTIRSGRHACVKVVRRMRLEEEPPFPALSIRFQITLWVVSILVVALMYVIMANA